jgi:microsomal dipeptidase-like Zn-dependent dipeptidase
MRRRLAIVAAVLAVAVALAFALGPGMVERGQNQVLRPGSHDVPAPIRALHERLLVADLHADALLWNRDLLLRSSYGHVDLPRLREGGVGLQVFAVVTKVPGGQNYDANNAGSDVITSLAILQRWPFAAWASLRARALYQAEKLHDVAARAGGDFRIIKTRADLDRFLAERRQRSALTAGLLAIEGLQALEGEAANLDVLAGAGFRMMGLTHFFDNELGGSAHGTGKGGLTPFGRQIVRQMESRGLLVDLAHASPAMIDDVLAMATRPVVVSHTGVKGTCEHIRNLSDAHVRGVARTGGVIGIGYWDAAVCDVGVAGIVRAIRHVIAVAGVDHVGLGSDFDGATTTPFDTAGVPQITAGLLEAGLSPADVEQIMGGNVARVLRATLPGG